MRLADGLALVIAVLALWQVLTDGAAGGLLRYVVPDVSASVLVSVLIAVLAVRHVAHPAPTALTRLRQAWRRAGDSALWGPVLRAFIGTRLMVFAVGVFAVVTFGLGERPGFQLSGNVLMNLPARFDAGWYGGIAMNGYQWNGSFDRQSNIAFFPAMPLLMRGVGSALGARDRERPVEVRMARMLWGGVAISLVAFLFALVHLMKVGAELIGEERAGNAVLLLACYPFAFVFNAPYTESLFLLASLAAIYQFQRQAWPLAGAWALLAGLTRPNGFLLAVPLGIIALQRLWSVPGVGDRPWRRPGVPELVVAGMPVVGVLIFTVYLVAVTGEWFAWSRTHGAWGRTFEGLEPAASAWRLVGEHGLVNFVLTEPYKSLNALALGFALVMTWPVFRRLGLAWAAYVVVMVIPPLLAGGVLSMGRLTSTLFPLFLSLAAIVPQRSMPHWAATFALLQGLCAALFFTWRHLY